MWPAGWIELPCCLHVESLQVPFVLSTAGSMDWHQCTKCNQTHCGRLPSRSMHGCIHFSLSCITHCTNACTNATTSASLRYPVVCLQVCSAALAIFSCRWFKDHLLQVSHSAWRCINSQLFNGPRSTLQSPCLAEQLYTCHSSPAAISTRCSLHKKDPADLSSLAAEALGCHASGGDI